MLEVRIVNSADFGRKSKVIPPSDFYICCDDGLPLENKFKKHGEYSFKKNKKSKKYSFENSSNTELHLDEFLKNFPEKETTEVKNFCIKKKVKTLIIGEKTYPNYSHAFEIAEFISPTGGAFSLKSPIDGGSDREFKNQRDFQRWLLFTNPLSRKHFIHEFLDNYIGKGKESQKINIETENEL